MQEENNKKCFTFEVEKMYENYRLELWLQELFSFEYSRTLIQKWIEKSCVKLKSRNNKKLKKSTRVQEKEVYEINIPLQIVSDIKPIELPFKIIYEDEYIALIHKPAALAVHPGPNQINKITLLNALIQRWPEIYYFQQKHQKHIEEKNNRDNTKQKEEWELEGNRQGIVHRLDKDTEGLLIVAKNEKTQIQFMKLFQERNIEKTYVAWTFNTPRENLKEENRKIIEEQTFIELPIARHPKYRWKRRVDLNRGKKASMLYKIIKTEFWHKMQQSRKFSKLEMEILTGRTHQIRVHLSYMAAPIVGDLLYSKSKSWHEKFGMLLFAKKLCFIHPFTQENLKFQLEEPQRFLEFENYLKNNKITD